MQHKILVILSKVSLRDTDRTPKLMSVFSCKLFIYSEKRFLFYSLWSPGYLLHSPQTEVHSPSLNGSSSSCSLGEGSSGCRGSMLMMSCLFKEWELRLWVILVLKTNRRQIGVLPNLNKEPSLHLATRVRDLL